MGGTISTSKSADLPVSQEVYTQIYSYFHPGAIVPTKKKGPNFSDKQSLEAAKKVSNFIKILLEEFAKDNSSNPKLTMEFPLRRYFKGSIDHVILGVDIWMRWVMNEGVNKHLKIRYHSQWVESDVSSKIVQGCQIEAEKVVIDQTPANQEKEEKKDQ